MEFRRKQRGQQLQSVAGSRCAEGIRKWGGTRGMNHCYEMWILLCLCGENDESDYPGPSPSKHNPRTTLSQLSLGHHVPAY